MKRHITYAILLAIFTLTQTGCFFQALPHVTKGLVDVTIKVSTEKLAQKVARDKEEAWRSAAETAKARKVKQPSVYEKLIPITSDEPATEGSVGEEINNG